jgi:hypothetical protein
MIIWAELYFVLDTNSKDPTKNDGQISQLQVFQFCITGDRSFDLYLYQHFPRRNTSNAFSQAALSRRFVQGIYISNNNSFCKHHSQASFAKLIDWFVSAFLHQKTTLESALEPAEEGYYHTIYICSFYEHHSQPSFAKPIDRSISTFLHQNTTIKSVPMFAEEGYITIYSLQVPSNISE